MRVTNSMISKNYLKDLNRNLTSLNKLNGQLTSGKEISRPSDNPFKAARIMQLKSDIDMSNQYNENIKDSINWLDTTDTALSQITESFQRIRELMVSTGNATYDKVQMASIKEEINERVNEIAQTLNTNFDGKYIFGGTKTASKPVNTMTDANGNIKLHLSGSNGEILNFDTTEFNEQNQIRNIGGNLYVEIAKNVSIDYNVNAIDVLKINDSKGNTLDLTELLSNITSNLDNEANWSTVYSDNLANLDLFMDNLNMLRSEVGAKQNRMESAESQNEEIKFNLTNLLSKTQDIDFAEKYLEVATLQTVYVAALQTSANIIKPTILDYL